MGEGADLGFLPLAPAIALPKEETLLTGNSAQGTQQRNPGLTQDTTYLSGRGIQE